MLGPNFLFPEHHQDPPEEHIYDGPGSIPRNISQENGEEYSVVGPPLGSCPHNGRANGSEVANRR